LSPWTMNQSCGRLCLIMLAGCCLAIGQATTPAQNPPATSTSGGPEVEAEKPCIEPAPLFSADDYNGPFNKAVSFLSRKLEIKTVHVPHRKPHGKLCGLDASEKFNLFLKNNLEPVAFVGAGFNSAIAQAENDDRSFGQGIAGYGKRYGAALADSASSDFFHTFLFPVIFRQDPRYYRRLEGSTSTRLGHALSHVFVARSDSGSRMINFSEWFGTASATALANTYHPGNRRGLGPTASRFGVNIGTDMGFDVLREFWPDLVHKLKLPFRQRDH